MLKQINIILGIIVTIGIAYSSYAITTEPAAVEQTPVEQSVIIQDFGRPLPGSEGDEWEEFNNLMGSKQASTDQEQE